MRSESSPIINGAINKFFIPEQFVSKKNKLNYEFMLKKMRRDQEDLTPNDVERMNRKKQRDYVRDFINEQRIVKKFPKRKFLPIHIDVKKKALEK